MIIIDGGRVGAAAPGEVAHLELAAREGADPQEDERAGRDGELRGQPDPEDGRAGRQQEQLKERQAAQQEAQPRDLVQHLQHLPGADDPARTPAHDPLPLRPQPLQGLPLRTPAQGTDQEEPQAEAGEVLAVSPEDRVLRAQPEPHDAHLHLHQQQGAHREGGAAPATTRGRGQGGIQLRVPEDQMQHPRK